MESDVKKLITISSNKELIDAFMRNPTFHSVVTFHEIKGSSYTVMLEDAVVRLISEIESKNKQMIMILGG